MGYTKYLKKGVKIVLKKGMKKGQEKLEEEKKEREVYAEEVANMPDEELMLYVPNVYQKSIYNIDYKKLKEHGIKLLSFDIDDTIADSFKNKTEGALGKVTMPDRAKRLFRELKEMGFIVTLLTNANRKVAADACEELQANDYIERADKPETRNFEKMMERYGMEPSQMAHIGNSMRDDICGGNRAGVTTCLVRRNGVSLKVVKVLQKGVGMSTRGHIIREKLLERDIWRKHHKFEEGDQYYQLGELPKYYKK